MSIREVLGVLVEQAKRVLPGNAPLENGKLGFFRRALEMPNFPQVVQLAKRTSKQDLFSSLSEVEAMEKACLQLEENACEIIIQSCLILTLAVEVNVIRPDDPILKGSVYFQFGWKLEQIACLRSRLSFVRPNTSLRRDIDRETLVSVFLSLVLARPTWREMLLLLKTAHQRLASSLVGYCAKLLENKTVDIPKPAATLFLSFMSDAFRNRRCGPSEEALIERLLELGASPMISADGHNAMFRMMHEHHWRAEVEPWWLEEPGYQTNTEGQRGTALYRLLNHLENGNEWSPALLLSLGENVCCNLDDQAPRKLRFPKKMLSLSCLAARRVKESDLALLPPRLKFKTSKHLPHKH